MEEDFKLLRGFCDWLTNKRTDICECRVAFATENSKEEEEDGSNLTAENEFIQGLLFILCCFSFIQIGYMFLKQSTSNQGLLSLSTKRDRQAAPPAPKVPLSGRPPIHLAYSNGVPLCQLQDASWRFILM